MLTKTIVALSAAILLAGSSAALAAKAKNPDQRKAARAAFASVPVNASSTGVFVGGKIIGRDPDVNVRQQLLRDYESWNR